MLSCCHAKGAEVMHECLVTILKPLSPGVPPPPDLITCVYMRQVMF